MCAQVGKNLTVSELAVDLSKVFDTSEDPTDFADLLSKGWSFHVEEQKVNASMGEAKVSALVSLMHGEAGTEEAPASFTIQGWHPTMRDTVTVASVHATSDVENELGRQMDESGIVKGVVRDAMCKVLCRSLTPFPCPLAFTRTTLYCTQPSVAHNLVLHTTLYYTQQCTPHNVVLHTTFHYYLQAFMASVTSDTDLVSLVMTDLSITTLLRVGSVCSLWRACSLRRLRELAVANKLIYRHFLDHYVLRNADTALIESGYDVDVRLEREANSTEHPLVGVASTLIFDISHSSMGMLRGLTWLNDEIIDAFMWLLGVCPNVCCTSTYFWTFLLEGRNLSRWYTTVNLGDLHRMLVPMNVHGNHWTLMVVNLTLYRLEYYDSLFGAPPRQAGELISVRVYERILFIRLGI